MKFCIDPTDDYELFGDDNYNTSKAIDVVIVRCSKGSGVVCKTDTEINDFVRALAVWTLYAHKEV